MKKFCSRIPSKEARSFLFMLYKTIVVGRTHFHMHDHPNVLRNVRSSLYHLFKNPVYAYRGIDVSHLFYNKHMLSRIRKENGASIIYWKNTWSSSEYYSWSTALFDALSYAQRQRTGMTKTDNRRHMGRSIILKTKAHKKNIYYHYGILKHKDIQRAFKKLHYIMRKKIMWSPSWHELILKHPYQQTLKYIIEFNRTYNDVHLKPTDKINLTFQL